MSKKLTNSQCLKLMQRVAKFGKKYNILLKQLEEQYKLRTGYNPSDIDDDTFIDTYHYCPGECPQTVAEVALEFGRAKEVANPAFCSEAARKAIERKAGEAAT